MKTIPQLQIALDYITLPPALVMASLVADEIDIIEIGTPLCKAAGIAAIHAMREVCPDKLILADFKTPDVGGLEAAMAFDAGADMVTVIGGAALATVKQAYEVARDRGKEMLMELTGVRDILERAAEWRQIGVDRIVYHREWDAQDAGREWGEEDKATIRQLIDMGYKVTVTGGLTLELLPFFADLPASVLICGRGIREAPDPRAAARAIRLAIADLWSGSYSGVPSSRPRSITTDLAAKAVRFVVSEMGLLLTVDGRECPGCDSPGRFCVGTRSEIVTPAGIDTQTLVNRIAAMIDPAGGQAVGWSQPGTFYLDVGLLPRLDESTVAGLLSATGSALNALGYRVDASTALEITHRIFSE
jgi:3-dehydro-L-gulonate-6-phosphate decarboxylase